MGSQGGSPCGAKQRQLRCASRTRRLASRRTTCCSAAELSPFESPEGSDSMVGVYVNYQCVVCSEWRGTNIRTEPWGETINCFGRGGAERSRQTYRHRCTDTRRSRDREKRAASICELSIPVFSVFYHINCGYRKYLPGPVGLRKMAQSVRFGPFRPFWGRFFGDRSSNQDYILNF